MILIKVFTVLYELHYKRETSSIAHEMQSEDRLIVLRQAFEERGVSVAEWARRRGFNVALVYALLSGRTRGLRGRGHLIAIELGLKQSPQPTTAWLERVFDEQHLPAGASSGFARTTNSQEAAL